jgi:hypothetical protein
LFGHDAFFRMAILRESHVTRTHPRD